MFNKMKYNFEDRFLKEKEQQLQVENIINQGYIVPVLLYYLVKFNFKGLYNCRVAIQGNT